MTWQVGNMRKASLFFAVFLFVLGVTNLHAQQSGNLRVWRIGAMDRVGQKDAVKDTGPIKLFAARNESESFQIVVTASGGNLNGVTITASDLTSKSGVISAETISLFREHYIALKKNNTGAKVIMSKYPDALIPHRNPYNNADPSGVKYDAFPFDVNAGMNQPLWIEIHVPNDAAAGTYSGFVTVKSSSGDSVKVPYKLRVFDFSLPKIPSLQSFFGIWEIEKYYKTKWGSDRWQTILRRYTDFLIDHRMAHEFPQELDFDVDKNGNLLLDEHITPAKTVREMFEYYMVTRGMSAIVIPVDESFPFRDPFGANRSRVITYLRNFMAYAKNEGWFDRTYIYTIDEPNNAREYEQVRKWGKLIDEASTELRHLVSEQPRPDKAAWGSLVGFVDIWDVQNSAITKEEAKARIAAGDELWTYTAEREDNFSPKWFIDYLPVEYRLYAWLAVSYGMVGLEYWETCWWWNTNDPWEIMSEYKNYERFISEGNILYPGTVPTVGFEGPIASMRFKWVRESFEDYEYFVKLRELNQQKFIVKILKKTANTWRDWTKDPALLIKYKMKAGKRIERLLKK